VKAAEWKRAARPLAEVLPGFRPIKFGFSRVHEWIAECVAADTSAFSANAFYVQAFALPRFVPTDHLYFDYGFRIGGRWERVSPELVGEVRRALPRLSELATLDGLLAATAQWKLNLYHAEVRLGIAVLREDVVVFDSTRATIATWTPTLAWEPEVMSRCATLAGAVDRGGFPAGLAELKGRRSEVDRLLG
jgi:hypothetical protein